METTWQNLSDPIFHHAETRPDAPALIDGGARLSYRELAALVAKATVYLRDLGIGEGDRVGVALANSAEHIILVFALARIGATLVELSPDDNADALGATARKYGIRTIFTEAMVAPPLGPVQFRVGIRWLHDLQPKSGDVRSAADADALQIISLTTGSTGEPHALIASHRQWMHRIAARIELYRRHHIDRQQQPGNFLLTAPVRHGWFFVAFLAQFFAGGPVVVLPEFQKKWDLLRFVASWDDALCYATANMCRFLIESAPDAGCLLPNLRLLESGGLPLFADEKRALLTRVTPHFFESYGTAGIGMISAIAPTEMITRPGSVGRPAPGVELEIVDAQDRPVPPGGDGRIRCRSTSMSLRRCAEDGDIQSAERLVGGWYYPGDIGTLDKDGFLYLKGRTADVVRRAGGDVFTSEIEAAIMSHPAVADAAVIVRQLPGGGDALVAFIVRRGALDHDVLAQFCRTKLTPERMPDNVYYIDALPRIGADKVDRMRLGEIAAQHAAPRPGR
ncbi:MAG TPA: class I adenylate-forming enzyme family protein [Stellaceae bacterium]|jgi:acyl-coenzyme A synthetase/AMP-(fatty) acid ligase|nr:class I adenylate-forming enzyme family protein [Stellaceae bacterium]